MKQKKIIIETPEKVHLNHVIAEVFTRVAAYIADLIIQGLVIILLALIKILEFGASGINEDNIMWTITVYYILTFFFQWFYFVFFETILNGSTPGKKICGIKVIKYNGERLDFSTIALRNLLRAADSIPLPGSGILGGFVAIISKQNKRLGDIVSGTLVVQDNNSNIIEPNFKTEFKKQSKSIITKISTGNRLSEKDLYIMRKLLNSVSDSPKAAESAAEMIVSKLKKRYDLSILDGKTNIEIIEEIYKAHTYEN